MEAKKILEPIPLFKLFKTFRQPILIGMVLMAISSTMISFFIICYIEAVDRFTRFFKMPNKNNLYYCPHVKIFHYELNNEIYGHGN